MTGNLTTAVESTNRINHLEFVPDSGMFFTATDAERMGSYFVPHIGMAPKWCAYLDNLTEELEEKGEEDQYQDWVFVTSDQIDQLGASNLIGSGYLKPYMHGYYVHRKTYQRISTVLD